MQMMELPIWEAAPYHTNITLVATDGGCRKSPVGPRASWGWATQCGLTRCGPVPGQHQTAQRGEVTAVARAITNIDGKLDILTNSRYVHDTVL